MSLSQHCRGELARFLFVVALPSALQLACAARTAEVRPPSRPADATLRVLNRTSEGVKLETDERPLGEVAAGGEQLFPGLPPGTLNLRGFSAGGGLEFRRDLLTLEPGETFTWILREEVSLSGRAARGGEDAVIVVENETRWPVEVALDGDVLGVTEAAGRARFEGIAPGAHRLEARATDPSTQISFRGEYPVLKPGEVFIWRLRDGGADPTAGILPAPGTGRLRVENPHGEPLVVSANGTALGTVEPREVRIFEDLPAGRVLLVARSGDDGTRFPGPSARIDPGRVTTWRIGPPEGALTSDVTEGAAPETVIVGETAESAPASAAGAGPGRESEAAVAGGPDVSPPASEPLPGDVATGAGEPAYPEARAPAADAPPAANRVFIVENRTTQDLEVFLDGESAGAVGAGMTERFTPLPALRFVPSAATASGTRRFEHPPVDLTSQETFTWIIEP